MGSAINPSSLFLQRACMNMLKYKIMSRKYKGCIFLLLVIINGAFLHAWPYGSNKRYYDFKVQTTSVTKLCKTSTIITVNGMYPGPSIYAQEDDRVIVKVTNLTPYNLSIHW